jgi:DNA (cytosine-5)-methyltransferase 1
MAAWGRGGRAYRVPVSMWPVRYPYAHLADLLQDPAPLSARATRGFLSRARASNLRFVDGFLADVAAHLERVGERQISAA